MSAARYNPITHHGEVGAPESARSKGLKLSTCAATVGHLQGGACMTKETPRKPGAGPSPKARREAAAAAAPQLPAKVDHLAGTACVPRPGTQEPARRSGGGSGAHGSGEAGGEPAVNLRASVDHLAGAGAHSCIWARGRLDTLMGASPRA